MWICFRDFIERIDYREDRCNPKIIPSVDYKRKRFETASLYYTIKIWYTPLKVLKAKNGDPVI